MKKTNKIKQNLEMAAASLAWGGYCFWFVYYALTKIF